MDKREELKNLLNELYAFMKEKLGFDEDISLELENDKENAKDPLGKTAFYDPDNKKIVIMITGRHDKDLLRSFAHECVHHWQNCNNKIAKDVNTEEGYAQKDNNLRELERQAYEQGNMLFRDWEDNKKNTKKENNNMFEMRNKKLNEKLMLTFGFKKVKEDITIPGEGGLYQGGEDNPDADIENSDNQDQLEMGIKVEMEHTNNPEIAKKIALDHLKEDPQYYTKLTKAGL